MVFEIIILYILEMALKRLRLLIFPFILAAVMVLLPSADGFAQEQRSLELDKLLEELVANHDRIKSAEASLEGMKHRHKSARGAYLPQIEATAEGGSENINKADETNTYLWRNEQTISATQLIYDFGETSGAVDAAEGQVREYDALLTQAKQEIVSLGITAYLRVIRSRELLKYAYRSENSMMELSGMQEVLVERGAGYSYEELQVKGQLAGAQSYRVAQQRELQTSLNNFKSVFGFVPTEKEVQNMASVPVPRKHMPGNVDEALKVAYDNNPMLQETKFTIERLQGDLKTADSNFYPKFDAVAEAERKEKDQGSLGVRHEARTSVQVSYNLFSGFSNTEDSQAMKSDIISARRTLLDRKRTVEEGVRNAWLELTTLRQNADLYETQANITWEFLGLVKKKKATGEEVRLLDILVGERDYINAISAKIATDIDIIIAGYSLLYQMGLITEDITEI